jgi:hypothetical protein
LRIGKVKEIIERVTQRLILNSWQGYGQQISSLSDRAVATDSNQTIEMGSIHFRYRFISIEVYAAKTNVAIDHKLL